MNAWNEVRAEVKISCMYTRETVHYECMCFRSEINQGVK